MKVRSFIQLREEKIKLPDNAVYLLSNYRDVVETHDSQKFGGRTVAYVDSQYLFRSYQGCLFYYKTN